MHDPANVVKAVDLELIEQPECWRRDSTCRTADYFDFFVFSFLVRFDTDIYVPTVLQPDLVPFFNCLTIEETSAMSLPLGATDCAGSQTSEIADLT